jgi:hypothetical protein
MVWIFLAVSATAYSTVRVFSKFITTPGVSMLSPDEAARSGRLSKPLPSESLEE